MKNGNGSLAPRPLPDGLAPPAAGRLDMDLRAAVDILRKRRWAALLFALVVEAGVALWTLRQPKIYRATATVQVELEAPRVLGREVEQVEDLGNSGYWNARDYIETQQQVARSRAVTRRVVEALRLDQDRELLAILFGPRARPPTLEQIADRLRKNITVNPVRDTRLFQIAAEDRSPERAQRIANALAEAYLEQNMEGRIAATEQALQWLQQQSDKLRGDLESSERELYEFKRGENVLVVPSQDDRNIAVQRVERLSEALTDARIKTIELGARREQIRALDLADPLAPSLDTLSRDSVLHKLRESYVALADEHVKLGSRYGPEHPRLKQVAAQMETMKASLARGAAQLLRFVEGEYQAAARAQGALEGELAQAQAEAMKLSLLEIRYNQLRRERENNEKMFALVLGREKETNLSRLLKINNLRVLDAAQRPEGPSRPRVTLNLLLGLLIALGGGIGLAFLLESLDTTVKTQDELEAAGVSCLGLVPRIDSAEAKRKTRHKDLTGNPDLFVWEHPKSSVAECIRSVRTSLMFASPDRELRTFLVTSSGPLEGKTTIAVSLAITMAQTGSRVLLVDTDMRRPRVHKALRMPNDRGVTSIVIGESAPEAAFQPTVVPGLTLLACGPLPPNPAEILQTEKFRAMFADLQQRFDRIVFDSPPVAAVTDAAILSTLVDATLLVVRSQHTRKDAVARMVRQLREVGARLTGAVLNNVAPEHREYGYYYYQRYGYYYGYGEHENAEAGHAGKENAAS